MARRLDLDRMRRRAQAVQDAQAERAAAAAAALWAAPLGRFVAGFAEALTRAVLPRPAPVVPDLRIDVRVPELGHVLGRLEQQP